MDKADYELIDKLLRSEILPAMGCTEPAAVALCVAKARETLGRSPESITVRMSPNVLKNAMAVGIPGTGMTGLPIAVALGAVMGKSSNCLEVLEGSTDADIEAARRLIDSGAIILAVKPCIQEKLYIEAECRAGDSIAVAVISGSHTRFVYISRNCETLLSLDGEASREASADGGGLTFRKIYDYSMSAPLEDISFILDGAEINRNAAGEALDKDYGHTLGKTIRKERWYNVMGGGIMSDVLAYTSAACDARMGGAPVAVMSNSGSGNQGITATLPVYVFGKSNGNTDEEIIRALTLSGLTVIYIKQNLGRLSALCGCVVAATGSSCGITHLLGGGYTHATYAVKNMIANLTGMICDGAKPSCSMKISSAASTAVLSAMLAVEEKCATSLEGIIDEDVDKCIRNLTAIGSEGMLRTDEMILDIMVNK